MGEIKFLEINELQSAYLELLVDFDKICRNNGLRYSICGGTLLGAVRHKGFIPWDDDADVTMPRPDYEKLLSLYLDGKLNIPAHRDIVSCRNRSFMRHFARFIRYDLHNYSEFQQDNECPYIGLDIFTADGLPENDKDYKILTRRIEMNRKLLLTKMSKKGTGKGSKLKIFAKGIVRGILQPVDGYRIVSKMERLCKTYDYNASSRVGALNGVFGVEENWLKSDMEQFAELEFEGHRFMAYKNYPIYLSQLYGDYMKLPPKEKQVPHCDAAYWVTPEK